jgi:hypothetical protein
MSDIVKKQTTAVTEAKAAPRGLENRTDQSDLILPRAKKIEAMSPEMQDEACIKSGVMPGKIINSITKEVLPEKFVPVLFFKNWIRWNANKMGERGWVDGFGPRDIIYMTQDKNDPRLIEDTKWNEDMPPLATTYFNFLSIFEGQEVPVIVTFGGTNARAGRELLSLATFKGGDLFSNKYRLTTKKVDGDKGTYYVLKVAFAEGATGEEYQLADTLYQSFASKEVKVHTEESERTPF